MRISPLIAIALASVATASISGASEQAPALNMDLDHEAAMRVAREADIGSSRDPSWSFFRTGGVTLPLWVSDPRPAPTVELQLDLNLSPKAGKMDPFAVVRSTASGRLLTHLGTPGSVWQPYVGYGFSSTTIRGAPSLLTPNGPLGMQGGSTSHLLLGMVHDTRDNPVDPRHGGSEELAVRIASPATGSIYSFGQFTATARHFFPLGPRLVLAGRVVADFLAGDVPFYETTSFGGIDSFEGMGGGKSVRGVPTERFTGTAKVLANLELRAVLVEPLIFGRHVRVEAVGFTDFGTAWSPNIAGGAPSGLLASVGGGIRLISGPIALRLDAGVSPKGGGVYVGIGHVF